MMLGRGVFALSGNSAIVALLAILTTTSKAMAGLIYRDGPAPVLGPSNILVFLPGSVLSVINTPPSTSPTRSSIIRVSDQITHSSQSSFTTKSPSQQLVTMSLGTASSKTHSISIQSSFTTESPSSTSAPNQQLVTMSTGTVGLKGPSISTAPVIPSPGGNGSSLAGPPSSRNVTLVAALSGSLGVVIITLVGLCITWYLRRRRLRRMHSSEVPSAATPGGTRFRSLFGGQWSWGSGLSGGETSVAVSAVPEDALNHEHTAQQSRASWDDIRQTESDKPEENNTNSRHASSTRACYGGPHPALSDSPPVPILPSSVFGRSAAITSEVSVSRPTIPSRRPRQEEDGGVRIVGGRPDAEVQSDGNTETSSLQTLPPPYSEYL